VPLYRLTEHSSSPIDFGFSLEPNEGGRLEKCFVDISSIDSLSRIVTGPLKSPQDILGAEVALRGIIFHDAINIIKPCIQNEYIHDLFGKSFRSNPSEESETKYEGILNVLEDANRHEHIGAIDWLVSFKDQEIADKYIETHNSRREILLKEREEKDDNLVSWALCYEIGKFEFVANTIEEYFKVTCKTDEYLLNNFLRRVPIAGYATYFSDSSYRSYLHKIEKNNPNQFFKPIDETWKEKTTSLLDYIVKIPMQPLLAIVLNRASKRENIPEEIIALREEFSEARSQLWLHFDDAQLRTTTSAKVASKILNSIEEESKLIIPKSFSTDEPVFPFTFQFLKNLMMQQPAGLLKDVGACAKANGIFDFHFVSATKLLQASLESIEWENLPNKHFTELELNKLSKNEWDWVP